MINEIVILMLAEAAKMPGKDRVTAILDVMMDVDRELIKIIITAKDLDKRLAINENQG